MAQDYDTLYYNRDRFYLTHLPESYQEDTLYSLVIALHGGLGSGSQLEGQSLLSEKADEAGFIVVYPDGFKSILGIRTWNGGACCGGAVNNDIDDVGFINKLIDVLMEDYSIDSNRIYATGISNGGFMSYRLACELSDRIAGIAPVAATMNTICEPENPVGVIHFQSELDESIPYQGGVGDGLSDHYNPPYDSVMNAWASHNNCLQIDTVQDDSNYLQVKWSDCDCDQEQNYYLTTDGGHSWHGGASTFGGDASSSLSANDLMWNFFLTHPKCANESTSMKEVLKEELQDDWFYDLLGRPVFYGDKEEAVKVLERNTVYLSKVYGKVMVVE